MIYTYIFDFRLIKGHTISAFQCNKLYFWIKFDKQILVSFAIAWGNIWIPSFVFCPTRISTKLMPLNQKAIRWASGTFEEKFPVDWIHIAEDLFYSSVTLCQLNCEQFTFINFARLVLIAFAVFYVTIVGAMKLRTAFMQVETDYFE